MRSATGGLHCQLALAGVVLLLTGARATAEGWQGKAALDPPRRLLAAAAEGGKIYTFGGCGSPCFEPPLHTSTEEETKVQVYDPATDEWTTKRPMPTILFGAAAAAPGNGLIYTVGGYLSGNVLQKYDPAADSWRLGPPMPTARYGAAAVALGGKIYVVGGSGPSAALEVYDPAADTWKSLASMRYPRVFLAAAVLDGKIYAVGGSPDCCGGAVSAAVEIYDPQTGSWHDGAPLPEPRQVSAAAAVNGRIYVFGGFVPGSGVRADTYEYDPEPGAWTVRSQMPTPRDQAPAVVLDGKAYVLGGSTDCHCRARAENESYTPLAQPMPQPGPAADLEISLREDAGAAGVSSCTDVRYTIQVINHGPAAVAGARIEDVFPASLRDVSWMCRTRKAPPCKHAAGRGAIDEPVDLPAGASATYVVTASLDPAATAGTLVDTASVELPPGVTDAHPENNRRSVSVPIVPPRADLGVEAVLPDQVVVAGETAQYSLSVTNYGPCPAQGVCLTDSTPGAAPASGQPAASCPGVLLGTLAPGETAPPVAVARQIPCDRPAGPLGGVASVSSSPATSDPVAANDSAPVSIQVVVQADYKIEKSGPLLATAGSAIEYSIALTNLGPSCPTSGVSDRFPPELLDPHWCRGEGCAPERSGDLADQITLLPPSTLVPGGREAYRVTGAVSSLCTAPFSNTASVELPPGVDPHPENDASAVETSCLPAPGCADCSIPTLSDAGLFVLAFLLALVPLGRLRRRPSS
jgi:N-acetylneuraminic acid mutarotase